MSNYYYDSGYSHALKQCSWGVAVQGGEQTGGALEYPTYSVLDCEAFAMAEAVAIAADRGDPNPIFFGDNKQLLHAIRGEDDLQGKAALFLLESRTYMHNFKNPQFVWVPSNANIAHVVASSYLTPLSESL